MARRRFFVDQVRKGEAEISGEDAQHLTRVLRVEVGQKFEITDNQRVWLASVEMARKDLVRFSVIEEMSPGPELPPVTLYLALIKFDRFEWAVEKATELSATRIVPVEADRSERGLFDGSRKRVDRWRRIAREASEQSRRLRAPEIAEAIHLRDALQDASKYRIWFDERPGAPPLLRGAPFLRGGQPDPPPSRPAADDSSTALLIGPEGGWTDPERDSFAAAGWTAASLGPSVLRAETAVCAALAVITQLHITGA
ncbi:MAG TPA: RsmE family RNA methyltransferase [Bryobacteraceae bacterium]|jgi:16S rRNA (uracil1498-N3)-methyltransferase|nr:RsmE family RNA methyltransferase [Bryobacteraceae bacterium]